MKKLYAPWRNAYIAPDNKNNSSSQTCLFCKQIAACEDTKHFIVQRLHHCCIMLNKYPYNAGHLLIIPYSHVSAFDMLSKDAISEIMEAISTSITLLQQALHNQGTNVGVNLGGKVAGGSIPGHLHVHVLPRFEGDTNFLPVLADTKQISCDLHAMYNKLKKYFT